ncbi:MAG: LuxR family transcriptional regulator, partial [Gammaproteobacteria bacterium]|nr:LuxR family transcriptional regulator [Gammaproteobacteria bacterium]
MLSERERMVAERYATGETHKEIAAALHIAPATVRNHLASIYRKLDVRNKPGLINALSSHACIELVLPLP